MLVVPFVVGMLAAGPAPVHLPLAVLWVVGYFDFYAVGLWLKSRRKTRYVPPVRAYSIALVVPAAAVLALRPGLVVWAPAFAPLVVISLWCSHRRRDRSLLNDATTVLAACLMLPVAFFAGIPAPALPGSTPAGSVLPGSALPGSTLSDAGGWLGQAGPANWPQVWVATALVLVYFFGTVLYVKTLIRRRGDRGFLAVSVGYHAVVTVAAAGLTAAVGQAWGPVVVVFALLAARSWWVPRTAAKPIQFGLGEFAASVVVGALALGVVGLLG